MNGIEVNYRRANSKRFARKEFGNVDDARAFVDAHVTEWATFYVRRFEVVNTRAFLEGKVCIS